MRRAAVLLAAGAVGWSLGEVFDLLGADLDLGGPWVLWAMHPGDDGPCIHSVPVPPPCECVCPPAGPALSRRGEL